MNSAEKLLGPEAEFFLPFLEEFSERVGKRDWRYLFLSEQIHTDLSNKDFSTGYYFYWLEILYRAHLSAVTSLLRSHRWLRAAIDAINQENALAFASCWRGFREGAADSWDGLGRVPESLAKNHREINRALNKQPGPVLLAKELEDTLIHFLVARKITKRDSAPDTHRAKRVKEYFEAFPDDKEAMYDFYGDLSEMTHSSHASIDIFLDLSTEGEYVLSVSLEKTFILKVLTKHRAVIPTLFFAGINPSVCILKVINEFPVEHLHSPELSHVRLDTLPMGKRIKQLIGKKEW